MATSSPPRPDGGASYLGWNLDAHRDLEPREQAILTALGAALVTKWGELPRHIQRSLFEAASGSDSDVREHIGRFLHDNAQFLHDQRPAGDNVAPGIA